MQITWIAKTAQPPDLNVIDLTVFGLSSLSVWRESFRTLNDIVAGAKLLFDKFDQDRLEKESQSFFKRHNQVLRA